MFLVVVIPFVLVACGGMPVTKVDVQSFEIKKAGIREEQALTALTDIFIDRGFAIKFTNKDDGVITTEYKKFASTGQNPLFDYYMQIKGHVKIVRNETSVTLSPIVKEQERLNASAFTEHELSYFTGDPSNIQLISSMRQGTGWRAFGQALFMDVVTDTAETFGLRVNDVIQNITNTPTSAISHNGKWLEPGCYANMFNENISYDLMKNTHLQKYFSTPSF